MKKIQVIFYFFLLVGIATTQAQNIDRVEPPHWWEGMKNAQLQLLIYGENIADLEPKIEDAAIGLLKTHKATKSDNYLFLDLDISKAKKGTYKIDFFKGKKIKLSHSYQIKERDQTAEEHVGFDSSDAIFLITPDRFANANPDNDIVSGLNESTIDRSDDYKRHGGDIQGITEHLDYIHDLGYTSIWPCPLLTNDMSEGSYHGYAVTDLYQIDPRFGTIEEYKTLSAEMTKREMKLVMDQVANHCGLEHWWMKDLPFEDWLNYQEHYENNVENWSSDVVIRSNHRRTSNQDNYASEIDKKGMTDGWFVKGMPDLNQRNPFMATYIIQNSIWWIEEANLSGIRQDTYPYPDKNFMSDWAGEIMNEYPNFSIVGEEWSYNPLLIAYWQDGNKNHDGYDSNLKSSMDFAMQRTVVEAIREDERWDTGLIKIYEGLANDFGYYSPKDILVFPDNHDMSRIHTQMDLDITNTKMALSYYAVIPRVLQMFYGTEILMDDLDKPGDHGLIRTDFPGGWASDKVNAFTGEGLTTDQKEMQQYVSKLLNFRKSSNAIHNGKTLHFAPENGVYVLFRISDDETVVHVINKNDKPYSLDLSRFNEVGLVGKQLRNIQTDASIMWDTTIELSEKGSYLFTTK
ncbi:glycoside hydrolase family 13 protein [Urechidicola sp. KH5]